MVFIVFLLLTSTVRSTSDSYTPPTQDESTKSYEDVSTSISDIKESTVESIHIKETTTRKTDNNLSEENSLALHYDEQDAIDIAKVLYRECRGVHSKTEQACVVWVILNRVDCYNSTIYSVIRSPNQFAFHEKTPIWDELLDLAYDVLNRWSREIDGEKNVGRVLPKEYIYFEGRDGHNYFRDNYSGSYNIWSYTLKSPYGS